MSKSRRTNRYGENLGEVHLWIEQGLKARLQHLAIDRRMPITKLVCELIERELAAEAAKSVTKATVDQLDAAFSGARS